MTKPLALTVALAFIVGVWPATPIAAEDASQPTVFVKAQDDGAYAVTARFDVRRPMAAVRAVLIDYEHIPQFMPQVQKSVVLERNDTHTLVEQQAVAQVLMFSKRLHLVLDIVERPDTIAFVDRCGQSFQRYEGSWRLSEQAGRTTVQYDLVAKPRFDAPDWLLAKLMKRDAIRTIERIQTEVARRGAL